MTAVLNAQRIIPGTPSDPEGESGENALKSGDSQPPESSGIDGIADSRKQFAALIVAKGQQRAKEGQSERPVAKEEEEDKEHDHKLRDGAE